MEIFECRSIFDTTASGTPEASISVAARCRRSWIVQRGRPASFARSWKCHSAFSGRIGAPSSRANTRFRPSGS